MGRSSKRSKREETEPEDEEIESDFEMDSDDSGNQLLPNVSSNHIDDEDESKNDESDDDYDDDDDEVEGSDGNASDEEENFGDGEADADSDEEGIENAERKDAEIEELEKEVKELQHKEEDLLRNLKRHKDEDTLKGQAVKSQKALWDKTLEFRFLLQKAFSNSNRLPQEPVRSSFCKSSDDVSEAYSELINSSRKTLDCILELQEALLEKNPAIAQAASVNSSKRSKLIEASDISNEKADEEWSKISQIHSRMASYRDKAIDKWHRKTQVTTGAAAIKGKLQAFNQNISEQVAGYMRDPSKMIRGMQQNRSAIALFGTVHDSTGNNNLEATKADGDPELLDDSEFYQQLLKEFFEAVDPTSSETAFYALKRLQKKKRKIVDRRASKSRKIRYNVHEKIKNFMAPQPMDLPDMAPKLFENLFGLRSQKPASGA